MNVKVFRETNFKDTELGPLPEEWQVVRLGEVAEVGPARITREHRDFVPFIPMSLLPENETFISHWELKSPKEIRSGVVVSDGDYLLAKITPSFENGKQGILRNLPGGWGYATTEVFPIRPQNKLVTEFLALYLLQQDVRQSLAARMEGTTGRQRLPKAVVLSLPIPLPPLPEQQAIAHVLRTVQEAKQATERVIAALRELKKSLMRHLFTYGPVPISDVGAQHAAPLQDTEIGPIPAHWQVVRLGEVVERTTQIDPKRNPGWEFKYVDVSSVDKESLRIVDYQICLGKDAPSRARKVIRSGDVIFATVRPSLKRIAIVQPAFDGQVCSTAFCVLRPKPTIVDGSFLFFSVSRDQFVASVSENQRGSSYPAITDNDVKRALIPLPPLPEQQEIARILRAVDGRIQAEEAYAHALDDLFKSLLRELMSGRLRVVPDSVAQSAVEAKHGLAPTLPTTAETRGG